MDSRKSSENVVWHPGRVPIETREALLGQRGCVLWLTGVSGSGKSTLAYALEERLIQRGHMAHVLDGDNVRHGLCGDLGFSPEDRAENIRRVGFVAGLFADAGVITIASFISPYREGRQRAREAIGPQRFLEVFLAVPLEVCEARDPKGLYRRARAGDLEGMTGLDSPYEAPTSPDLQLGTHVDPVPDCVDQLQGLLRSRGFLPMKSGD